MYQAVGKSDKSRYLKVYQEPGSQRTAKKHTTEQPAGFKTQKKPGASFTTVDDINPALLYGP